jgi:hypothetical protein
MKNESLRSLMLAVNGFAVGFLFIHTSLRLVDFLMFGLAGISMVWYTKIK